MTARGRLKSGGEKMSDSSDYMERVREAFEAYCVTRLNTRESAEAFKVLSDVILGY